MMVNKAFCKSISGSFGRIIAYREGKSISRVSVNSHKNKMLLFHNESGPVKSTCHLVAG